jgi:hypothetical protein
MESRTKVFVPYERRYFTVCMYVYIYIYSFCMWELSVSQAALSSDRPYARRDKRQVSDKVLPK